MKLIVVPLLIISLACFSQNTAQDYINKYKEIAVEEMNLFKIPASITLSQGILESSNGDSFLAKEANNHFGIKCHNSWEGDRVYYDDDEQDECFRKYSTAEDSYRDHSLFLSNSSRYSTLFDLPIKRYKLWARGLKKAGYATNPKYAALLIGIIRKYNLNKFDRLEHDSKQFYFSNVYGFPYLYGFGVNFIDDKLILDIKLQSSFVFINKSSISCNYLLFNQIYLGTNVGLLYIKEDLNYNLGFQLYYVKKLQANKRNQYVIISLGNDIVFNDINEFSEHRLLPFVSLSHLF
ncbi:MAG: glucosaminidase domain-containing protein [Flavobacteriales bacterium]|nr:glucosaminidase domain-containing protein [Flavobacteriales bacterium]